MSLITCCPACGTMFKVVPDQLRISEGWVRCGHCAEVFDAAAHLQNGAAPPVQEQPAPPQDAFAAPPQQVFEHGSVAQEFLAPENMPAAEEAPAAVAPADYAYPPFVLERPEPDEPAGALDEEPQESAPGLAPDGELAPSPEFGDVSFVRQARRKAFWRRPAVRAGLGLLVLVLGALFALQFAFQDRDRLAASQPLLRPVLEALCQQAQCAIGPPRQIEAITIDSSSFSKLRSEAYRLNVTLKNQAAVAVAMPAIELTLTDSQDQPLVRRVLTPSDMGASSGVIGAASDWSGALAMSVPAAGGAGRIAGYRLLAFYP